MRGKRITLLWLLNAITRRLFGRVLTKEVYITKFFWYGTSRAATRWYWDDADKHPLEREYKCE